MSYPMIMSHENRVLKWLSVVAVAASILMSQVANTLRIGGFTTEEVADQYQNLFTPAHFTFAIWSVIHFLLVAYVVYQFSGVRMRMNSLIGEHVYQRIGILVIIASLLNIGWTLTWHFRVIDASLLLSIALFIVLSVIVRKVNQISFQERTLYDYICLILPFTLYFGWITMVAVANAKAWLVSIGWGLLYENPPFWFAAALIIGLVIGIWNSVYLRDLGYAVVLVWATFGILVEHISSQGHNAQYPAAIVILAIALVVLVMNALYIVVLRNRIRASL